MDFSSLRIDPNQSPHSESDTSNARSFPFRAREGSEDMMTDTGYQAAAKPPKRGRHGAFQPTDEQRKNVKILVSLGVPHSAICAIIRDHKDRPIDEKTRRRRRSAP